MRVPFSEVFTVSDGQITPKITVKIGGVTMSPGAVIGETVRISGVNLSEHVGKDLEVEYLADGTVEIKGVFN